jgi:hypothetical protein
MQEVEAELRYLQTIFEAQQAMAASAEAFGAHGAAAAGHTGAPEWRAWSGRETSHADRSASEMEEINDTIVNVFDKILFQHTESLQTMPQAVLERFAEVSWPPLCMHRFQSVTVSS